MADHFSKMGKRLTAIGKSVKAVKSLQEHRAQISRTIDEVNRHADAIEAFNLPVEPKVEHKELSQKEQKELRMAAAALIEELKPLLDKLKIAVHNARDSGYKLEEWFTNSEKANGEFERFAKEKIANNPVLSLEVTNELIEHLTNIKQMAEHFSDIFKRLTSELDEVQQLAEQLANKIQQKGDEISRKANNKKWRIVLAAVVLTSGVGGLVALGFFTGGVTWAAAAGAIGGAIAALGIGLTAKKTTMDVASMRELAGNIEKNFKQMDTLARELKKACDRAETIELSPDCVEELNSALKFFRISPDPKSRIAQLESQLRSNGIEPV